MRAQRQVARTAIAALAFAVLTSNANAAPGRTAPPQGLVDQRGDAFRIEDLRGTPTILTFVAARCTDACPLIEAQIASAAHDARTRMRNVRFLTITLDPEHDTPAVMRSIANRFDARAPRWLLLSGNPSLIHTLMRRFNVVAERGADGVPEMHTTFVYVLNSQGRTAQTLLASPDLTQQIFEAIAR